MGFYNLKIHQAIFLFYLILCFQPLLTNYSIVKQEESDFTSSKGVVSKSISSNSVLYKIKDNITVFYNPPLIDLQCYIHTPIINEYQSIVCMGDVKSDPPGYIKSYEFLKKVQSYKLHKIRNIEQWCVYF